MDITSQSNRVGRVLVEPGSTFFTEVILERAICLVANTVCCIGHASVCSCVECHCLVYLGLRKLTQFNQCCGRFFFATNGHVVHHIAVMVHNRRHVVVLVAGRQDLFTHHGLGVVGTACLF